MDVIFRGPSSVAACSGYSHAGTTGDPGRRGHAIVAEIENNEIRPTFPNSASTPRACFRVYTRLKRSSTSLKPLYRLSKLQNLGSGTDACGTPMPVPSKPKAVLHFYTTSKSERDALIAPTYGNCFKYDGVEGYVAPSDLGGLQQLFRLYNPAADSWILVPSSHVTTANGLGYTQQQSSLGWVVPN